MSATFSDKQYESSSLPSEVNLHVSLVQLRSGTDENWKVSIIGHLRLESSDCEINSADSF